MNWDDDSKNEESPIIKTISKMKMTPKIKITSKMKTTSSLQGPVLDSVGGIPLPMLNHVAKASFRIFVIPQKFSCRATLGNTLTFNTEIRFEKCA